MDQSLLAICEAIKKIFLQLKPSTPLSFVLLTGKTGQGKTTLLKQSHFHCFPLEQDYSIQLFYSNEGILLELGETWLTQSQALLVHTLKKLNRCQKNLKISGIILCIDSSELLLAEPLQLVSLCQSHIQLIERFGKALGYRTDTSIFFTKIDSIAGFCEFFQSDHAFDLQKPLGFSLESNSEPSKLLNNYKKKFEEMIEDLGQHIIHKLHPARSTAKRILIREFPLQLATLRVPIQTLLHKLPIQFFRLHTLYFTSAEQGGLSIDRLNQKIQREYALIVQDRFPQSKNYRAYFINGALSAFLAQTQYLIPQTPMKQKLYISILSTTAGLLFTLLGYHHFKITHLLDETSKELISYDTFINQKNNTAAFYHLSLAENKINAINNWLFLPVIEHLKSELHQNAQKKLHLHFLPDMVNHIEYAMMDSSNPPAARYQALKIYLMLAEPQHFSQAVVLQWFKEYWQKENPHSMDDIPMAVLKQALTLPIQPIPIKKQLVMDVRNYLNALPPAYLYYSIAKQSFSMEKTIITMKGFDIPVRELPYYYTKAGFQKTLQSLEAISATLTKENWVLARQDLEYLQKQLEQAYCFEYITWWKNFINRTQPQHYQGYQQARKLMQTLTNAQSMTHLIHFIQENTKPNLNHSASLFNQKIASQFTNINLITASSITELSENIHELEQFIATLSVVQDDGQTLFNLTKSRFEDNSIPDPLTKLYKRSHQLPIPIASWAKQIADDSWYIFISASKTYLNKKWYSEVFQPYQKIIANRYPIDSLQKEEISLEDFNLFFAPKGILNNYIAQYLKPFLDTSQPQWQPKELDGYVLPISNDLLNELIRANVISNMFFPHGQEKSKIDFTLQKISLDPVVANLQLRLGDSVLDDNQSTDSYTFFNWPQENATLSLHSIEGNSYKLEEKGIWAFFKILQKVNVLVDNNDSSSLQILFEINGNSGRYTLKTENQINPFSPGILTGFTLNPEIA